MNNNFSSFIAELRKEQGLTQKELADRVGVSDKSCFQVGKRSFHTKEILRNNLCLPACKNTNV